MSDNIRTKPVSLNESTLETNIASEIASIFNSTFNFGYSRRLRSILGFRRINIDALRSRKTKLYRLTPIEENRGGGWDTKISIPVGNNGQRAIFIQFKSGRHSDGNTISNSVFSLNKKNPNSHAEFKFNDNANNNQHFTLKKLSDSINTQGLSSDSVMYAFPRITDLEKFDKLEEDLLLHTTFLTIPEIDRESTINQVNLYDGKEHYFRTSYHDENKREVSSVPFLLSEENKSQSVIYEIILTKICRYKNLILDYFYSYDLDEELMLSLAQYLRINPMERIDSDRLSFSSSYKSELNRIFNRLVESRNENFKVIYGASDDSTQYNWRLNLFDRVYKFLIDRERDKKVNIQNEVPSQFTSILSNTEYEFDGEPNVGVTMIVF